MNWITPNNLIVAGVVLASIIIIQIVKFGILVYRRRQVKKYNRFVDATYTDNAKATPALILRVQDGNIRLYNEFLKRSRLLSLFFKQMDYAGGHPMEIID